MYYHTPLPLNLANKQASKRATTSPFRFGYCSVSSLRALLYSSHPRDYIGPSPNPSFEPKTHRWRPGGRVPNREVPSQNCSFCALNQPFLAQNGPKNQRKTAKRRQTVTTLHVRLDFLVTKSPLLPSTSRICPRNGPKMAKNGPEYAQLVSNSPETKNCPYLGLVATIPIARAPSPPATPKFCDFQASESPNETPRPPYQWSCGGAIGQLGPRTMGATPLVGPPGSPGRKRRFFPKLFVDHLGCSNKYF